MTIDVPTLQKISKNIYILALFAKMTKTTVDDRLVEMLQNIADDEEALELVVKFLSWIPLFGATPDGVDAEEPELTPNLEPFRDVLTECRNNLRDCDC